MVGVPKVYVKGPEGSVATYSFSSLITGKGYVRFYGSVGDDGSAVAFLSENVVDCYPPYTDGIYTNSDTPTLLLEKNFDILFDRSAIIDGKGYVNCTWQEDPDGSTDAVGYLKVKVIHVNAAAAETVLVTVQTPNLTASVTGLAERVAVELEIARTLFSAGEKLRLSIEVWAGGTNATDDGVVRLWHDSTNGIKTTLLSEQGITLDTAVTFDVPFKVDL